MAGSISSSYGDDDEPISNINVTPLVDVTLVLLIVFMITVPAIVGSSRVKVNVPETTSVAVDPTDNIPLTFALKKGEGGKPILYLNDKEIDEDGVKKMFSSWGKANAEQQVSLAADRDIDYGRVMKVIDLLESVGLKKLALDTRHVEAR
jgi:biopolymer transport protein ExbD